MFEKKMDEAHRKYKQSRSRYLVEDWVIYNGEYPMWWFTGTWQEVRAKYGDRPIYRAKDVEKTYIKKDGATFISLKPEEAKRRGFEEAPEW